MGTSPGEARPRTRPERSAALDARWAPALGVCLTIGILGPAADAGTLRVLSLALVLAAAGAALLAAGTPGRAGVRAVAGMAALSCVAGGLVAQGVAADRALDTLTGWDRVVAGGERHRIELVPTAAPTPRVGAFGAQRVTAPVSVRAVGDHGAPLPEPRPAVLTGDADWLEAPTGRPQCAIVSAERADGTVFLRAHAPPRPGPCAHGGPGEPGDDAAGDHGGEGAGEGVTGREALRAGLRAAAAGGPGLAPELVPGLVLGDRSVQSEQTDRAMKDAGLSHLSAVSGANCAIIAAVVTVALRAVGARRAVVTTGVLGTLAVFVVVVGPEPSVLRAAVMGGAGALALLSGRGRQVMSLLCVAGVGLLIVEPALAVEPALHLSLAATAGIVIGARPLEALLHRPLDRVLPSWAARWLSVSLAVTASAQLACQPILILLTGSLSPYAILANLLAAPLVPPVTVLGTAAAALVVPLPWLAQVLVGVVGVPAAGIGAVALGVAQAPGAVRPWPPGSVGTALWVLSTVATLVGFHALLRWERRPQARVVRRGRLARPRRRRRPAEYALGVLTAALLAAGAGGVGAVVLPVPLGTAAGDWDAAFCDVGQGDMTVLRSGGDRAVVVDVGPDPALARACLAALRVRHVDAVLLTHLHADHTGGLAGLTGELDPGRILYGGLPAAARAGVAVGAGEERGSTAGAPPEGRRLTTGDRERVGGVSWTVLWADQRAPSENDASAQVLATVDTDAGPLTVLLTGDMEQEASAAWVRGHAAGALEVPRDVHVLSVAHHGARNGGADLPRAVDADLHVISAGADNPYGHPHRQTLQALAPLGALARTDESGTLVVALEGAAPGRADGPRLEVRSIGRAPAPP